MAFTSYYFFAGSKAEGEQQEGGYTDNSTWVVKPRHLLLLVVHKF